MDWIKTDIRGTYTPVDMGQIQRERIGANRIVAGIALMVLVAVALTVYALAMWLAGGK